MLSIAMITATSVYITPSGTRDSQLSMPCSTTPPASPRCAQSHHVTRKHASQRPGGAVVRASPSHDRDARGVGQTVTDAWDGRHHVAHLDADAPHVYVHRAHPAGPAAPHRAEQFLPPEDPPRMAYEVSQQVELRVRQGDRPAVD